jgi:bifunctional non-homologous end joining protein LigD
VRKAFRIVRTGDGFVLELASGADRRAWRIARGPSLDPTHRRVATELHDNAVAPATTWDEGQWTTATALASLDAVDAMELSLKGGKLHGAWRLERSGASRWVFTKLRDDFAISGADVSAIDEAFATLPQAADVARQARQAPASSARGRKPSFIPLALATLADAPPSGPEWLHEVKLDGYRIEAIVDNGTVRLMSRNEKDWTARFPTIASALRDLDVSSVILDGEIVAVNERGVSSFQQLQQSFDAPTSPTLRYYVFDVLSLDGQLLTSRTLSDRLPLLQQVIGKPSRHAVVQLTARYDPAKGDVLKQACSAGEEGVISKRLDARYLHGRGRNWIKAKCGRRQEFIIVGYTDPQGSRLGFGSLLLAVNEKGALQFAGRVGTGFDTKLLDSIYRKLRALEVTENPLGSKPPGIPPRTIHWVKPQLVAEVAFTEWTDDGLLRHPSFKGLREDKRPDQVRRENA